MRVGIIQLGRLGDVVNAIPIAYMLALEGHEVHWYVSKNNAVVLEPCSYIHVHSLDLRDDAVLEATKIAEKDSLDRILITQVNGNPTEPLVYCENFTLKQWANAGIEFLTRYHDYRPLFDKRDRKAEEQIIARLPKPDGRPLLVVNFKSHSSPYAHTVSQWDWIFKAFSKSHRIYDLTDKRFDKPQYVLAVLSQADCLITVDTLSLHLAYATMTPTIQMSAGTNPQGRPSPFYDSEPRKHVVLKTTYIESIAPVVRARIEKIIKEKDFAPGRCTRPLFEENTISAALVSGGRKIYHVADWYLGNVGDNPRILRARATWEDLRRDPDYTIIEHRLVNGQRSSKDLGDTRTLPYITDIIDRGCTEPATDKDIVVFSNSDVALVPEALAVLRQKMEKMDCCFSRRVDVLNFDTRHTLNTLKGKSAHVGADLFAFRIGWWKEHRDEIPAVFLAAEGWDAVSRWWCLKHNPKAEIETPICFHAVHRPFWSRPSQIHTNPAQIYNRKVCEEWVRGNGLDVTLFGKQSTYLFKPDDVWQAKTLLSED